MADPESDFGVDMAVRVYPETEQERRGIVLEDCGDLAGVEVRIGDHHIAGPAKRWAVRLDTGELIFVNSDQLAAVLE